MVKLYFFHFSLSIVITFWCREMHQLKILHQYLTFPRTVGIVIRYELPLFSSAGIFMRAATWELLFQVEWYQTYLRKHITKKISSDKYSKWAGTVRQRGRSLVDNGAE